MSVVAKNVLFCEGLPEGSLDKPLLSRLMGTQLGWTIEAGGTKEGLARYAQGYLASGEGRRWLVVRDRDFDQEPPPEPSLLPDPRTTKNVVCLWRTSVESYLLDPGLIHRYWAEGREGGRAEFRNPETRDQIQDRIRRAAGDLVPYQSLRWALATLRRDQPRALSNTWTEGSGHLPPKEDLRWEQGLRRAQDLVQSARPLGLDPTAVLRLAEGFRDRFAAPSFLDSEQPLIWFSPKDLIKQMQRQDPNLFGLQDYLAWAVGQFDPAAHRDLHELATRLQQPTP